MSDTALIVPLAWRSKENIESERHEIYRRDLLSDAIDTAAAKLCLQRSTGTLLCKCEVNGFKRWSKLKLKAKTLEASIGLRHNPLQRDPRGRSTSVPAKLSRS